MIMTLIGGSNRDYEKELDCGYYIFVKPIEQADSLVVPHGSK